VGRFVAEVVIPSQFDLMWPTLEALKRLGGSGQIDEIVEAVVDAEGFTEEQQEVRRGPGDRMSKIEYHLAWARNGLKNIGAIENSARGVWAITDLGRSLDADETRDRVKAWRTDYNRRYHEQRRRAALDDGSDEVDPDSEPDWKDVLRGAMSGHGEEGLLITTATFTPRQGRRPPGTARHQSTSSAATTCATS
jgi:restriction system protein